MKQKQYVLVANLKSRQTETAIEEVRQAFKTKKKDVEIIAVKDPKKLNAAFKKALGKRPDVIVLGGGDGTLISGIEYLSSKDFDGEIGLIPLGTANYLPRNLSIPLDIDGSIDVLLRGKSRTVPIGVANDKYFALMCSIGLVQAVAEQVSDKLKRKLGQVAYMLELLKQTKQHEPFKYHIESPDLKRPIKGTTHQILVYNSDLNKQVKLVPDHSLSKPTLKLLINRTGHSKLKLYIGFLVHIISFGKFRPYMYTLETSSLHITTTPKMRSDLDGEPQGESPFDIHMAEHPVRIIC